MADEISYAVSLKVEKSELKLPTVSHSDRATMTGTRIYMTTQGIGTTYEAVGLGADISTVGWSYWKNTDATNYVEVGVEVAAAFYPLVKLKPGEACLFPLATSSIFAKANTAAVDLFAIICMA